ncbi:PAS domain S-box protein [Candidatus Bathyarchaeota archaeon]|nr:PAS domain S-box protein [Candidatus Bathyarchaeota archaeon]
MRRAGNRKMMKPHLFPISTSKVFKCLFAKANDGIILLDREGKVLEINRRVEKLLNLKRKECVGRKIRDTVPKKILSKIPRDLWDILKKKQAKCELELTAKNKKPINVEIVLTPCINQGKIVGVLGIVRDITKDKLLKETLCDSEERYRNLVESAPDVIYTISKDGKITSLNPAFEKITGWPPARWIGKPFDRLIHPDDLPLATQTFYMALNGKQPPSYELRIRSKSGKYLVGEFTSTPYMKNSKSIGEFGIVRDITERKKTEETVKFSEIRFRTLFENVPDGIYQSSPEGKIITANPALIEMLGYSTLEELQAANISRDMYVNPEDRRRWMQRLEKQDKVRNVELLLKRKDGKPIIVLENSHAVRDDRGNVLYFEGTLTDITERKRLEERLSVLNYYGGKLNAAKTLRQIYELTLDALEKTLEVDSAVFLKVVKNSLCPVARRGKPHASNDLLLSSDKGITVKAANTRQPVLVPDVTKNKDYIEGIPDVRSELAVPVETEEKLLGVLDVESKKLNAFNEKDVTLLQILASHVATAIGNVEKREEIEKRSSQLMLLMKSSADVIYTTNLHKRLNRIAKAIKNLGWRRVVISVRDSKMELTSPDDLVTAGLTKEERDFLWENRPPGQVWRERFGPEYKRFKIGEFYYLPWSDPLVRKRFSEGTVPSNLSKEEMVDWDPQDLLYAPLRLADGRIVGILSIDDPVDGKKPTRESLAPLELFIHQAAVAIENAQLFQQLNKAKNQLNEYARCLEEKVKERTINLKRNEEKLRSIITATPNAITATDLNGIITECNEHTLKLHGFSSKAELIGKSAFELIAKKDHERAFEGIKKTLEEGYVRDREYTLITKDGREFPAELSASVVRDDSGRPIGFVAITSDITERKRMEKQLLKSERLAAIGEVAAMVGHDLRNPLTGIAAAAYYLKTKQNQKSNSKTWEMLEIIEKNVEYSNKIVNDLLDYSREMRLECTQTNPYALVKEALAMDIPANIKVRDQTSTSPEIIVDVEKMKRLFTNLIKNALEAMPKGGVLTISSRQVSSNVEFRFTDTGVSMTQEILEKIWSPLFTTKAKGMGLGLAICKRIAEAHKGKISVSSKIGKGTTFIVTIPIKPSLEGGENIWVNVPESLLSTTMKA